MGQTVDTIGVDIVARLDKLEASLRQAEAKVGASADRMNRRAGRVGDAQFGGMGKLAIMGVKVATVLGGINLAVQGASVFSDAWAISSALIAGNYQKANKAVESMENTMRNMPIIGGSYDQISGWLTRQFTSFGTGGRSKGLGALMNPNPAAMDPARAAEELYNNIAEEIDKANREFDITVAKTPQEKARVKYQQDLEDARRTKEKLMGTVGVNPDQANELEIAQQELARVKLKDALKQKVGGMFDTFNTAFGVMKVAARGAPTKQDKAAEDTAKNTKKTADVLTRLLDRGGAIVAFG